MPSNEAGRYKFNGTNRQGEKVNRISLEGGSVNPNRYLDLGGEAELSAEEVERLRARGFKLHKVGDPEHDSGSSPEGAEAPVIADKADQQRDQAQGAAGTPAVASKAPTEKPKEGR